MASMQEKAQCVLWFYESRSPITVQRQFQREYGRYPPDVKSIKGWYEKFKETGSVGDKTRSGTLGVSDETVDTVHIAFHRSPQKSMRHASRETGISQSTIVKILHKRLHFHAHKVQILQALMPEDKPRRVEFATLMLERIDADNDYLIKVCFSDEATFHTSRNVKRHNVQIWGLENPHVVLQHIRERLK